MKIRIARNGEEIARVDSVEMLRHVVKGSSVRLEDHAFVEGSEDWITVHQLLDDGGFGGEVIPADDGIEDDSSNLSLDPLAHVIQPRPMESGVSTGKEPRKRHRVYAIPLVFLGLAVLMILVALSQKEGITDVDIPILAQREVKEAGALFNEGAELYAKGTIKWWNDDEELIKQAENRFENAWESLHGGAKYPDGVLISEKQNVKLLRDDLEDKLKECRELTNWLPWPL